MFGEISVGAWLEHAIHGPGSFRFLVQPVIAILLGIRDGRRDARGGRTPYLLGLVVDHPNRRANLRAGLKATMVPLAVALVLDCCLQYFIVGGVDIVVAVVVAMLLIVLPYMSSRALTNRALTRRGGHQPASPSVPIAP